MTFSIVIPCYNEAENIPLILNRFRKAMRQDISLEVILVNNGSSDKTAQTLLELLPQYSFADTVYIPENQGYGYGILCGLRQAHGDYIGWTHADMQTDPTDVIKACCLIKQKGGGNIFVKGARKKRSLFDRLFTIGMSVFESLYLRRILTDINAQPNLFPASFYRTWENPPHDFSLDLYALYMAKRRKMQVLRFDVKFPPRIHGKSSWNNGIKDKVKFIKRTISFSVKLKRGRIS